MSTNIKKRFMEVGYEYGTNEMKYIKDNLKCYIDNQGAYIRICQADRWQIKLEHDAQVKYLVLDYILNHFSLWELYIIFYTNQVNCSIDEESIQKARKISIRTINNDSSLTRQEANRLKKKVWDLNPVIFGLTLEMIQLSELFWDSKEKKLVFPDIDFQSHYSWNSSFEHYQSLYGNYNQDIII
jgi:hypothetical protein